MLGNYKNLIVWQKAVDLADEVYKLTSKFPKSEDFNLKSQMRRCAVSIPSNIAEGKMRDTDKSFRQFLFISYGSCAELETQIEIAKRIPETSNLDYNKMQEQLQAIMKMLNTIIKKLS